MHVGPKMQWYATRARLASSIISHHLSLLSSWTMNIIQWTACHIFKLKRNEIWRSNWISSKRIFSITHVVRYLSCMLMPENHDFLFKTFACRSHHRRKFYMSYHLVQANKHCCTPLHVAILGSLRLMNIFFTGSIACGGDKNYWQEPTMILHGRVGWKKFISWEEKL